MNYVEGASMLVTRQFLEEIGIMCEDYFLYFEEADWAIRAEGRFKLAYAPESIVYHKVGGSIGTSSNPAKKSYTCDYFNIRNRLLFTRRFYPTALPVNLSGPTRVAPASPFPGEMGSSCHDSQVVTRVYRQTA